MTAVHGSQVNKPGLGSSTLRKNGSRIVPRNLSQANASLFRNIRVGGSWGSQSTQIANFQKSRFSANRSESAPRARGTFANSYNIADNLKIQNGSKEYTAGQVVGQSISMALGILNQIGIIGNNKAQPQGAAAQLDNAVASLGGGSIKATSSDVALSITNMAACDDVGSLSAAIGNAKGQLSSMEGAIPGLEQQVQQAKTTLSGLEQKEKTAERDEKEKKQAVSTCKNGVTIATGARDRALADVKKADSDYGEKLENYVKAQDAHKDAQCATKRATANVTNTTNAYSQAQAATASAQAAYDAIGDGPENAGQKAVAKARLDQAKQAESNAKTAMEKAKEELKSAETKEQQAKANLDTAQKAKDEAYKKLADTKGAVDKAEAGLKKEQEKLDDTKDNLEKAEENYDAAKQAHQELQNQVESENSVINAVETYKNDVKALKNAIGDQEKRLETLQKSGAKDKKDPAPAAEKKDPAPAADENHEQLPQGTLPSDDVLNNMTKDQLESLKNGHRWTSEETIRLNNLIDKAEQQAS